MSRFIMLLPEELAARAAAVRIWERCCDYIRGCRGFKETAANNNCVWFQKGKYTVMVANASPGIISIDWYWDVGIFRKVRRYDNLPAYYPSRPTAAEEAASFEKFLDYLAIVLKKL